MKPESAKKIAIVTILFAAILMVFVSYETYFKKEGPVTTSEGKSRRSDREIELIALLSVKYDIEEEKIAGLLEDYDKTLLTRESGDGNTARQNIKYNIIFMSNKYVLDKEIVADILLEYRDWAERGIPPGKTPDSPDDDWDRWQRWDK